MKKYKITYPANITVVVEASNDEVALNKAQKITLKAANDLKIFLEPIGNRIDCNEIDV